MKRLVTNENSPFITIMPKYGFDSAKRYGGAFNVFNMALGRFDPYIFHRDSLLRHNPHIVFSGYYIGLVTFFDSRGIYQKIKQL